jgi:hypothetical protein
MIRSVEQIPLPERIPALTQMVLSARGQKDAYAQQEAEYLDMLARAEAEIGNQAIPKSGLIEQNPYQATGKEPPPPHKGKDIQHDSE